MQERTPLALLIPILLVLVLILLSHTPSRAYLSPWTPNSPFEAALRGQTSNKGLSAALVLQPPADDPFAARRQAVTTGAMVPGALAMEAYNQSSVLVDATPDQHIRYYTRALEGGGRLAYFVVQLSERVHVEVLTADGAIPGSDARGDTIWVDGQQHLATVEEMARAPYAERARMVLMGAMALGFHGAARTSPEGTVVINGTAHHVNPRRATLCLSDAGAAVIGLFGEEALRHCDQAIGAGPVVLWNGKIANPDVATETDEFVPFNPLGEDFVQLDWRKKIYTGGYPKSVVGVGSRADGGSYLVLLVSEDITGIDLARQLKAMGCIDALGGDDDTSTQAVWQGAPLQTRRVRAVPNALAVYYRLDS